jgi:hypothetical protein
VVGCSNEQPTASPAPEAPAYKILTKADLEEALVEVAQLPPGYSQDPPYEGAGNKYFSDYQPKAEGLATPPRE